MGDVNVRMFSQSRRVCECKGRSGSAKTRMEVGVNMSEE